MMSKKAGGHSDRTGSPANRSRIAAVARDQSRRGRNLLRKKRVSARVKSEGSVSKVKHDHEGGAWEPKAGAVVYRGMPQLIDTQARHAAVSRFREEYQRVKAGLASTDMPSHRLRGLRIRLRIFLDEHRRALPRDEAAALRALIEDVDHTIARL